MGETNKNFTVSPTILLSKHPVFLSTFQTGFMLDSKLSQITTFKLLTLKVFWQIREEYLIPRHIKLQGRSEHYNRSSESSV